MTSPFNEAGEPIMSGEQWRYEQYLDQEADHMRPEPEDMADLIMDEDEEIENDDHPTEEEIKEIMN